MSGYWNRKQSAVVLMSFSGYCPTLYNMFPSSISLFSRIIMMSGLPCDIAQVAGPAVQVDGNNAQHENSIKTGERNKMFKKRAEVSI